MLWSHCGPASHVFTHLNVPNPLQPAELKALDRKKKQERKRRDLIFFVEMERNLANSFARGELIPGIPYKETKTEGPPKEPHHKSRVRTISGMDDMLLAELRDDSNSNLRRQDQHQRQPMVTVQTNASLAGKCEIQTTGRVHLSSTLEGRPPLPVSRQHHHHAAVQKDGSDGMQTSSGITEKVKPPLQKPRPELAGEKSVAAPIHDDGRKLGAEMTGVTSPPTSGGHARRNTGGTIYLQNTMTNPDIKATIKCVCGVYRAHIVQASSDRAKKQRTISSHEYGVFNDDFGSLTNRKVVRVPPLSEVLEFYEAFYLRSQMEHDTIITSLIYLERVIKCTDGTLAPSPENWRSLLFASMVLASKVWDDLSMWNVDFSNVTARTAGLSSFTLPRINQLELALLKCLKFDVKVPASEYAKYYFLIRTMLLRSGLVKEDEKPLCKRQAFQKLESLTSTYLDQPRDRRTKSMDFENVSNVLATDSLPSGPVLKDSICLEQLIG
jgi:Cyclin